MNPTFSRSARAVVAIAALHVIIGLVGAVSVETNTALFGANVYVAYCGWLVANTGRRVALAGFAAGYLALYLLVMVLLGSESLFLLLVIVYASVYRVRLLLGLFAAFVLSHVVLQPYAVESFAILAPLLLVVHGARRRGLGTFPLACLWLGLLALGLVLLPFLHLLVAEAPQTLLLAAARDDVQRAILTSMVTAGVATLIVAAFGIPLAYALARIPLRGRSTIETLIDLPILIPQSVVGIALLSLLGHGSPLGRALEDAGLGVVGRCSGIVLAQIVVACPFMIKAAVTAFEGVPTRLQDASLTLGAGPLATFVHVSLPLASRGILGGMVLCWGRAISEFGAIMLVAPRPVTVPVLANNEFIESGAPEARPIAAVFLLSCLFALALAQLGKRVLPSGCEPPTTPRETP